MPKNKSWIIRNELLEFMNDAQALRNNFQVFRKKVIRNEAQVLRDNDNDKTKNKDKTKDNTNATLDKINNKISTLNETSTIPAEIKVKLKISIN